MDEIVNDDELVKDNNCISLNEKAIENMEGNESTSNFSSSEEFFSSKDEGLNESQQDGWKERPQRQWKEWPHDWWVATKEVEWATIVFSNHGRNVEEWKCKEVERLLCKKNTTLLLSTTLGPWCHFSRVGSPLFANGCSKSNIWLIVKLSVTRPNSWQEVSPKHLELITTKLLHLL